MRVERASVARGYRKSVRAQGKLEEAGVPEGREACAVVAECLRQDIAFNSNINIEGTGEAEVQILTCSVRSASVHGRSSAEIRS